MNSKNLGGILDKINELRALFIFGQRVIPFLEELFYFVNDIVPVLEDINVSIYESANKMPRASSQLNKVTQATEIAATEILDNLDGVLSKLNAIGSHFQTATGDLTALGRLDDEEFEFLKKSLNENQKDILEKVIGSHTRKRDHLKALRSNAGGLEQSLQDIRTRANDIMISLQVQDITSQQIASVNHLIESVQDRLGNLIDRFKLSGADLVSEIEKAEHHTFDPLASYDRSGESQRAADEIVQGTAKLMGIPSKPGEPPADHASQDEIDKMFGKGAHH
jgi:chemotaxis regulatin CheY-phosphate phosphatase CheZ